MFQGDWKCAGCGGDIKELPFQPRSAEGLKCRDCHRQGQGGGNTSGGERKVVEGEWVCSGCSGKITSLPFEPRDTSNLKCLDCFKASRAA